MAYSKEVLDHFDNPRNIGVLDENDGDTGVSIVGAPSCGDVMRFSIKVKNGIIQDAKFQTFGCGSAIASSSYLTQEVIGKKLEDALTITNKDIANALVLPPIKHHCSVLAEEAIAKAIENYNFKQSKKND